MSLRRLVVEVDVASLNVAQFCRDHGISTWLFWDLRRRYAIEGDAALEPKSRAPKTVANKTPVAMEDVIVAKRKELDDAGLDCGPATIAFHLRGVKGVPSEATIWRILSARGFIVADPSKAPKVTSRSFTAERANDCWQIDDTGWELADGTEVKIFNVIDDHSRLAVASVATLSCTGTFALSVLAAAAPLLGWPARFLSDNARAFRNVLADAVGHLGVGSGHSRPYHPQTNGKVERFHQTLKKWLANQDPADTIENLQAQLDLFRLIYNHHRPHRSLDRHYPAQVWADAPKNGPADHPLGAVTKLYTGHVYAGRLTIGKRHLITVGSQHNGEYAIAVITGNQAHVFIDGTLVRELTIDPTRRSQPLKPRKPLP